MGVSAVLRSPRVGALAGTENGEEGRWSGSRRQALVGCLVLLIVTLGFFAPVFAGRTSSTVASHQTTVWPWRATTNPHVELLPQTDQADTYHPWQTYMSRTLRSGTVPLWNRHSFAGAPFFVNGQNGSLYPPRVVLGLLVSPSWAHDILMMLHMFLAGAAMFFLLRQLHCPFLANLFGAVAWMLNAHILGWMQLEFIGPLAVFLPASLVCVVRLHRRPSWRPATAAGLLLGLMIIGGQVQMAVLSALVVASYGVASMSGLLLGRIRSRPTTLVGRRLALVALVPAVAAASSAVVLIPTLLAARGVGRQPVTYRTMIEQSVIPLGRYAHALWPPDLPLTQVQLVGFSVFVGTATVLLALCGFFTRRQGVGLGRAAAVGTVLLTIGTPVTWLAYHLVPGFGYLVLGRLQYLFVFGIALLAGIGAAAVLEFGSTKRVFARRTVHSCVAVALLLTTAHLFWYGRRINPSFPPRQTALLYPRTGLIQALETNRNEHPPEEPQRFIPIGRSQQARVWHAPVLYSSQPMMFGLDSAGGYESVVPQRVADLWRVVGGAHPQDVLAKPLQSALVASFAAGRSRLELLPRVGVTTVVGPPDLVDDPRWNAEMSGSPVLRQLYKGRDGVVFDLEGVQPAAWVVFSEAVVPDRATALRRFVDPNFDHRRSVLLEEGTSTSVRARPAGARTGSARLVRRGTNTVFVEVESSHAGWLVLTDTWAPGWTARINGEPAPVLRGNYTFRAVRVPAGRSNVAMTYRPPGFVAGAAVSATAWSLSAAGLAFSMVRSRRRSRRVLPQGASVPPTASSPEVAAPAAGRVA